MRRRRTPHLGAALLVVTLAGCGNLEVRFDPAPLNAGLLPAAASTQEAPLLLGLTPTGQLTLNGELLELPTAHEPAFAGLTALDAGELPPPWRPPHALGGGVVVARLAKASAYAIAGLRPFDRVDAIDGAAVTTPAEVSEKLSDGAPHTLSVTRPTGEQLEVAASPAGRVEDATANYVPFLFERRAAPTGSALGVGPLDGLFYYRSRATLRFVEDPGRRYAEYAERFEVGFLFDLFHYVSETDLGTGVTHRGFRLLWFIPFGDVQ